MSGVLARSDDYPFVPITIHSGPPFQQRAYLDTGAEGFDVIIFDPLFDETLMEGPSYIRRVDLAGSRFSVRGDEYLAEVSIGETRKMASVIIVREDVTLRETLLGEGLLRQFVVVLDGPRDTVSIYSAGSRLALA